MCYIAVYKISRFFFFFFFFGGGVILTNKNIIMSSFKSSRDIQKKEGGPDSCFG